MNSQKIESCVKVIEGLPPLPVALNKLLSAIEDDNIGATDLATIIAYDQALSANILKLVNSAYYGYSQKISSIPHAIVLLGFSAIKSLALGLAVVNVFSQTSMEDCRKINFWEHSIGTALAGRMIMARVNKNYAEDAFVGGLLHDVGKLIFLISFKNEYVCMFEEDDGDSSALCTIEKQNIGIDHCYVGEMLAQRWNFPENLVAMIKFHHEPEKLKIYSQSMIVLEGLILYMANWISHLSVKNKGISACTTQKFFQIQDILKISDETVENIYESLEKNISQVKSFLGVN